MAKIEYRRMNEEYFQQCSKLLTKFYREETLRKIVGIADNPDAVAEYDQLIINCVKAGLSLVAVDTTTDRVVGHIFNRIKANTPNDNFLKNYVNSCKQTVTKENLRVVGKVLADFNIFEHCNTDCVMILMNLRVEKEYRGLGIASNLVKKSIELARKLLQGENVRQSIDGQTLLPLDYVPKIVQGWFTSYEAQQLARKLGFQVAKRVYFDDFSFQGKTYSELFRLVDPEEAARTPFFTIEYLRLN